MHRNEYVDIAGFSSARICRALTFALHRLSRLCSLSGICIYVGSKTSSPEKISLWIESLRKFFVLRSVRVFL